MDQMFSLASQILGNGGKVFAHNPELPAPGAKPATQADVTPHKDAAAPVRTVAAVVAASHPLRTAVRALKGRTPSQSSSKQLAPGFLTTFAASSTTSRSAGRAFTAATMRAASLPSASVT